MSEAHPRRDGHEWFRLRQEAEDVRFAAGAAVARAPEFFVSAVDTNRVQRAL